MKDITFIISVTNTMFVVLASIMILVRWGAYKGNSWRDFDFKQLIVETILLYVVLLVMAFLSSGDDSPPYDDFDPQDGGRWIH